ncbi:hypothetical protein [Pedobacter nyackensis]|uniref:Uncharacterized protein n=1 Tax=Pedobacter nyackensis TaxID=475255 RepID=A0A1W1ZW70_9SPHI|nr:hypothetical protein [Pedobacter nyackensis]SMC52623.1 hypothetical protein SAMN04488101_10199 [Pedobacter nyackensis]
MCALFTEISKHWIELLTLLAAIFTMVAAFKALAIWKDQRLHELKMEIFAVSRRSVDLIKYLRDPVSFDGEINQELLDSWKKHNPNELSTFTSKFLVFQSKLRFHDATYKEILFLRERVWAEFGDSHIFNIFYDYIIKTIVDLNSAHRQLTYLEKENVIDDPEFRSEKKELILRINAVGQDEITKTLEKNFDLLLKERVNHRLSQ